MMAAKDCIKNARYKLGMTQTEFAKMIGIAKQSISHYEQGLRHPYPKTGKKIVDELKKQGIDIDYNDLIDN